MHTLIDTILWGSKQIIKLAAMITIGTVFFVLPSIIMVVLLPLFYIDLWHTVGLGNEFALAMGVVSSMMTVVIHFIAVYDLYKLLGRWLRLEAKRPQEVKSIDEIRSYLPPILWTGGEVK